MKANLLLAALLSLACGVDAQVVLKTDSAFSAGPGKGRGYTVALKPEWGVLTLRTRMKTTDLVRGREGWMNGRKWERGLCAPDISLLESLAETLGVSILELN